MGLISDEDIIELKKEFEVIKEKVKIHFFSSKNDAVCTFCDKTREVLTEVASISDMVELVEHDNEADTENIEKYKIDKFPAMIITKDDDNDIGVKIFGIPAGHEFMALIAAILDIGGAEIEVPDWALEKVKEIDKPVHLQVFVTPT